MTNTLSFDLWLDDRWVGMSSGDTVFEARKKAENSYLDKSIGARILMTPFYGCGTSDATFKAITGKDSWNSKKLDNS